ncbi:MAG: acetyl-CoA carboxylase biotin carboxyl carrier protein [Eubacteriales bacterium]|nr:acetyl-CoA carboxylase biotin carboxyl carrier protein [Eubacteriales bacterium]
MEFKQIVELIRTVSDSKISQFEFQDGEIKLSMKKQKAQLQAALPLNSEETQRSSILSEEPDRERQGNIVKSPLVGTFYQAPSPEGEPFVQVGDCVKKGQVLGIVEAMKLMNEIESEYDGTVLEILAENKHMVEYGQPLFVIG